MPTVTIVPEQFAALLMAHLIPTTCLAVMDPSEEERRELEDAIAKFARRYQIHAAIVATQDADPGTP
jgi:hypothetical protein